MSKKFNKEEQKRIENLIIEKKEPYNQKIKLFPDGSVQIYQYKDLINIGTKINYDTRKEKEYNKDNKHSLFTSINRTKNNIYDLARSNKWDYFITLTFSAQKVNRNDYKKCSKIAREYFKNVRKNYSKNIKYLLVVDLHKDGAIHFHGLISNIGNLKSRIKDSGKKDNKNRIVYNLNFKSGFSTMTEIGSTEKAAGYITKYITKTAFEDKRLFNQKKYYFSNNLMIPTEYKDLINIDESTKKDLALTSQFTKSLKYCDIYNISCSPTT